MVYHERDKWLPSSIPLKRTRSYKVSSERCVVKPEKRMMGPVRRLVKKKKEKKRDVWLVLLEGKPYHRGARCLHAWKMIFIVVEP